MTTTKRDPRPVLSPESLYVGDNGRIHCGAVACAGACAAFTGRALDGGPVDRIDPAFVASWSASAGRPPECEQCGRRALALASVTGEALTVEAISVLPSDFPEVSDRDTARRAMDAVIALVGGAFHLDTSAEDYTSADGSPMFPGPEARRIDRAMSAAFDHLPDPYAIALDLMEKRGAITHD